MQYYRIYDWLVASEFELPCDPVATRSRPGSVDLAVRWSNQPFYEVDQLIWIDRAIGGRVRSYDAGSVVLLSIDDHVMLRITKDGREMTIWNGHADYDEAAIFVLGFGMSICTLFRGGMPLHAAGIALDEGVIGIMASSGVGKSTLLWSLLQAGARFVTDDVLPVRMIDGVMSAIPSGTIEAKLWGEQLKLLSATPLRAIAADTDKYWVQIDAQRRLAEPQPLLALFVLRPHHLFSAGAPPARPIAVRQEGSSAMLQLIYNTHGLFGVQRDRFRNLLPRYSQIVEHVPVYTLEYERTYAALPDLIALICDTARSTAPVSVSNDRLLVSA